MKIEKLDDDANEEFKPVSFKVTITSQKQAELLYFINDHSDIINHFDLEDTCNDTLDVLCGCVDGLEHKRLVETENKFISIFGGSR
jgi:hypothetical protein